MNSLSYNKLIMRLQNNDNVGDVLSDPSFSLLDMTKAITTGSPLVRLKLLKHCLDQPRYRLHVDAFFEQEAHNIDFGKTSLQWAQGFPQHTATILSYVLKHLQPIHYKDFIVGCDQRTDKKYSPDNPYNHAFLYDIFRLPHWPPNTIGLILDRVKRYCVEWQSIAAVNIGYNAKTQEDQTLISDFVENLPRLSLGEHYGVSALYDFITPIHKPLLGMFLKKLTEDDFKEFVNNLRTFWEPEQYEILAANIPNTLAFQQLFFEKMSEFHNCKWIDDHVYAKMEKFWLEANLPTRTQTSYKRKM